MERSCLRLMVRRHFVVSPGAPRIPLAQRRTMMGLFEEESPSGSGKTDVAAFARSMDHLESRNLRLDRKAHGIPFHVGEEAALDAVCRHHGTAVHVHGVERYMMPFWLGATAASGSFRADVLQKDPAFLTQQNCLVWVEGPRYEFHYPFGEHHVFNQVSASYLHPLAAVERCVAGTHVPSMLISRFELLRELEAMAAPPKVVPFAMSTVTALSILDTRLTRAMLLRRIDQELVKFHGSFVRSSVTVTSVFKESVGLRPVFLPMMKFTVSTGANVTPVPSFVCGATGKVVGPVLHLTPRAKLSSMALAGAAAMLALAPVVDPGVATAAAIASAAASVYLRRCLLTLRFLREQARQLAELKATGMLYFSSDQSGYRWSPEDEERAEYEYREELRQRARRKEAFEQRVKEEAARDEARSRRHIDPKNRRRTDLENVDPLGYYQLLGLTGRELNATAKDIARAFREAAQHHHPDVVHGDDDKAKHTMQRIIHAYKILRDPKTKKAYDSGQLTAQEESSG
ncbi:putative chaperone protein DNAj [Trypanosoma conorhini]|uniref:Putative chaperone protein DNAj n=1 Tax=Trypanosoma conorhini TaxID=83891 RepID=A0A3R7PL25_9TRYP|nr:putative chaperone protein DNAj [Trypanosoma conorhini]RNF26951.1 putative chaperone protein DNAj [Trypanosoma conorhini]